MLFLSTGAVCDVKECSQIQPTQMDAAELQEEILRVIDQIQSLTRENEVVVDDRSEGGHSRSGSFHEGASSRSGGDASLLEGVNLNAYYSVLVNLYSVFMPLLSERFINNLPNTLVCLLSGTPQCGLEAELTRTVSLELAKPLLALISFMRSETCAPLAVGSDSFARSHWRVDEVRAAEITAFQERLISVLSQVPLSGDLMSTISGLMDMVVSYFSSVMATLIQVPMDYVRIGLQFGIKVPSLNESEQCQQGSLKQLIMWGLAHNVSWSFGPSILDIFLVPSLCSYPGPQCTSPDDLFSRSATPASPTVADDDQDLLFRCDRHNLAVFNETMCADIFAAPRGEASSSSLAVFCHALSQLSPAQLERVWGNTCHAIQALMSPVLTQAPHCGTEGYTPSPPVLPPPPPAPPRLARSSPNLRNLVCNYGNWSQGEMVDAGLVSFCAENDRDRFAEQVCDHPPLMMSLLSDSNNHWMWGFCGNWSSNPGMLVSIFCVYQGWMAQPDVLVPPAMVAFCWKADGNRMKEMICDNVGLFTLLFSDPENSALIPNCTHLTPHLPPEDNLDTLVAESCRYSEWHDVKLISPDIISLCIRLDNADFVAKVCANATFLSMLLQSEAYPWLAGYCADMPQEAPPSVPPRFSSIFEWCDYETWDSRHVDPSVVGLCWQHDQSNFTENVCCNSTLLDKLTEESDNKWLFSVCGDRDAAEMISQVCRYTEWTSPIIVDMTDLAVCAELDPFNFTTRVCSNGTILQNLLANLDNTWLLKHCANVSRPEGPGDGSGGGGGLLGFKPSEQCQYTSWGMAVPDASLMALCWDYDQANFASFVCHDVGLLATLALDVSSVWVSQLCLSYTNYSTNASGSGGESQPCVARELVKRFNWSCSADLARVCLPGAGVSASLQAVVRCWLENLGHRLQGLSALKQAASITVVMLVGLEESQLTSLRVTENIRLSVLKSIAFYLERETNFNNKRVLLQCFGKVLTSLMQTGRDVTSKGSFLIKEYFWIPLGSARAVLSAVDITMARQILQYYGRNRNTLQLADDYLSVMVSAFLRVHLLNDISLFPDLAPLLPWASLADIKALPPLQANANIRETINANLALMSMAQRQAFGQWFSQAMAPLDMTSATPSLIRDTGNLITYLPFQSFQHLSPAQLLDGLEVLQRNTLSPLQQNFIAQSIVGSYKNLSIQDFNMLGTLCCLAEPSDLLLYKDTEVFPVIQSLITTCAQQGQYLPSHMIVLFLNHTDLRSPASLPPSSLSELVPFLPWLGVDFLQELSPSQLLPDFPALTSVSFTPTQASVILDKMPPSYTSAPGGLQALGTLVVGLKVETVRTLAANTLLSSLPGMAQNKAELGPPQANAIATKLWGSPDVVNWLVKVSPLLSGTPLRSVLPHTALLLANSTHTTTRPWNTQQAKALFREVMNSQPNLNQEQLLNIGTVGPGVSCPVLRRLFIARPSTSSVKRILRFLREQPTLLHTSLKNCVIEELYNFEFFAELLVEMGAEIALALPVSTVKKFPAVMMDTLRTMILQDPQPFLMLPRIKQELLVDKLVQRLGMYTGEYTEEELHSLGVMATFVVDEVFVQLRRSVFLDNMPLLQGFCYSATKREQVAAMLQEPGVFGPVQTWTPGTIGQVGRFLFFLSMDTLEQISPSLLSLSHVERLFLDQSQWEASMVGLHCVRNSPPDERLDWFTKEQFVLQYLLGFLMITSVPYVQPGCETLHTLAPSLWPINSLTSMPDRDFSNCLELMGRDPFLLQYQRIQLLNKAKKVHGPVSSLPSTVIPQLGGLSVELSLKELASLRLSQISSISAMGTVSTWTSRQLPVLFSTVVNSTTLSPNQMDSSTLVAMGHLVCGATVTEIQTFNAVEFCKAVLWLGQLRLTCSEEQLAAMVTLLSDSLAFGPMSSWGQDVFIEIGAFAAGLPDMAMSSLVKEQIEGVTPLALSLIPPDKFAVFSSSQISMFSYEQAVGVTAEQRAALSDSKRRALTLVLTPWEDRPLDFRGTNMQDRPPDPPVF
ncbi:Stereocilin [Merluccius polli]|uniref:Stereocilin n=1 Tax=Merluccius polli TaxID=89951 RepID=A0AA47P1F4_MERPO|nr:Stereocilin [Merluccius polli]